MKYLKQFLVILAFTFIGELLKYFIPLPIPASIYGMALLFIALLSGAVKLDAVKETADFLIKIMPIMFIPAGVGLMTTWGILSPILLPVSLVTVLAIITVMVVTGRLSQSIIYAERRKNK